MPFNKYRESQGRGEELTCLKYRVAHRNYCWQQKKSIVLKVIALDHPVSWSWLYYYAKSRLNNKQTLII